MSNFMHLRFLTKFWKTGVKIIFSVPLLCKFVVENFKLIFWRMTFYSGGRITPSQHSRTRFVIGCNFYALVRGCVGFLLVDVEVCLDGKWWISTLGFEATLMFVWMESDKFNFSLTLNLGVIVQYIYFAVCNSVPAVERMSILICNKAQSEIKGWKIADFQDSSVQNLLYLLGLLTNAFYVVFLKEQIFEVDKHFITSCTWN